MTTVLIIVAVIILLLVMLVVYSRQKMKNMPKVDDHENIITLNEKNFNQQTKGKVVLVDFWATWCAPCRLMAPALNDLASELADNKYRVGKVDVDANRGLAQKYNIRSIPTSVIFKDGKEVARIVGVKPKATLLKEIQKF